MKELYDKYADMVLNLALQYVHSYEDAEEITQDVFLKIFQKEHTFKGNAEFRTWIYRITINASLDFLRRKKAKKRFAVLVSILFGESDKTLFEPTDFNHPGIELEHKEALENLLGLINQLPERQKTVLILLKIEEKSQKETAAILHLSEKAVESLFQRAKQSLLKLHRKNKRN
jgi:RNA polymerase sigma-70 factor (ECF subfamily)